MTGQKPPTIRWRWPASRREHGTKVILATPHRKDVTESSSVVHIRELTEQMNGQLKVHGIDLTLLLGMENHLDLELLEDYSTGRALPINSSRYILVEMPFFGRPNYVEFVLFRSPGARPYPRVGAP